MLRFTSLVLCALVGCTCQAPKQRVQGTVLWRSYVGDQGVEVCFSALGPNAHVLQCGPIAGPWRTLYEGSSPRHTQPAFFASAEHVWIAPILGAWGGQPHVLVLDSATSSTMRIDLQQPGEVRLSANAVAVERPLTSNCRYPGRVLASLETGEQQCIPVAAGHLVPRTASLAAIIDASDGGCVRFLRVGASIDELGSALVEGARDGVFLTDDQLLVQGRDAQWWNVHVDGGVTRHALDGVLYSLSFAGEVDGEPLLVGVLGSRSVSAGHRGAVRLLLDGGVRVWSSSASPQEEVDAVFFESALHFVRTERDDAGLLWRLEAATTQESF